MVVVYSKPGCGSCVATKRALDKAGVKYRSVDVSVDSEAREMLIERGFSAMPVVALVRDVGSLGLAGFEASNVCVRLLLLRQPLRGCSR